MPATIYIVKEALFCRVYEESAWRFYVQLRRYKPIVKHIKKISADVVSLGFPKSQLPAVLEEAAAKGIIVDNEDAGGVVLKLLSEPEQPFHEWKKGFDVTCYQAIENSDILKEQPAGIMSIIREIESFPVANSTPMQSIQFLSDIQKKIKMVKKTPE